MTSSDLEREVDSGVENLLDLYLRLAVAHAVVADVELDIPRISELHVGLKDHHYYYRIIKKNIHIFMYYVTSHPHKSR